MWRGIAYALAGAFCFGLGTPLAKLLLGKGLSPLLLAGLLYLGSGFQALRLPGRHHPRPGRETELPLRPADFRWLLPATLFGGVLAPILLILGVSGSTGSQSSLLLCLEAVFTAGLAWIVFRETAGRRVVTGMGFLVAGSIVLSLQPGRFEVSWSCAAVAAACFCWGLDNNFSKQIADRDPVQITAVKGLLAGPVTLLVAAACGAFHPFPPLLPVAAALLVGFFSYGLCLEYMILSMRRIGAARMAAYFSTAPFFGAAFSILLLGDRPGLRLWGAACLMGIGLWLYATERAPVKEGS